MNNNVVTVCSNTYYFPNNYRISEMTNISVELYGETIHVPKLYYASKYDLYGKFYLQDGFIDVYIFQYNDYSFLIIRYVGDDGKIYRKIIKSKCGMNDIVDVTIYLP